MANKKDIIDDLKIVILSHADQLDKLLTRLDELEQSVDPDLGHNRRFPGFKNHHARLTALELAAGHGYGGPSIEERIMNLELRGSQLADLKVQERLDALENLTCDFDASALLKAARGDLRKGFSQIKAEEPEPTPEPEPQTEPTLEVDILLTRLHQACTQRDIGRYIEIRAQCQRVDSAAHRRGSRPPAIKMQRYFRDRRLDRHHILAHIRWTPEWGVTVLELDVNGVRAYELDEGTRRQLIAWNEASGGQLYNDAFQASHEPPYQPQLVELLRILDPAMHTPLEATASTQASTPS